MDIAITGASGLIGSALTDHLTARGDRVLRFVRERTSASDEAWWSPATGEIDASALEGIDAVVHLAGEPIASHRWSDEQKQRIRQSRTEGTSLIATTLAGLDTPPRVLVSSSGIHYYGDRGDEVLTEASDPGPEDFLTGVVLEWEAAAAPVTEAGVRLAIARTGVVLSDQGGALAEQLPFFKFGLGGRIGKGRQWFSWISLTDQVRALTWLIDQDVSGPHNLTAPAPVTNADFTSTLGEVLNRPTLVPIPKPALYLRLGKELTQSLLYSSIRVLPEALTAEGFEFTHADLESALRAELDR